MSVTTPYWAPFAKITISGSGFQPNENVVTTFGGTTVTATADSSGNVGFLLEAPNVSPQTLPIVLQGQTTGRSATYGFYVGALNPWALVSSWYIKAGDTVTFTGNQFAADETVNIEIGGVVVATATADSSGRFVNEGAYTLPGYPGSTLPVVLRGVKSGAVANLTISIGT